MSFSRRDILAIAGLGAGSTFLPSLHGYRRARAASFPRLLIVTSQHQIIPRAWVMRQNNPAGQAWKYDLSSVSDGAFSSVLEPLAAYKAKLNVIEGHGYYSGIPTKAYVNNHDASFMNLLTAAGVDLPRIRRSLSVRRWTR